MIVLVIFSARDASSQDHEQDQDHEQEKRCQRGAIQRRREPVI
jgi:hypothetical protein